MKLHPFQERAVRDLRRLLKIHRRVVAVSPTGSGKTVIGSAVLGASSRKRVLWLAHRIELLRQARDSLVAAGIAPEHVGILSGPEKVNTGARILVASVDMFRALPVPDVDLIVVDEAHHVTAQSYRDIIDARRNAQVLGLTATPERLDGAPLGDVFNHLHVVAETIELVADGHLLPSVVYGIPREKARELVRGASGGGKDYSPSKLEQAMKKRPLMADIVKERARLAPNEPTIVYAVTREHGRELARRFEKAGVPTAYVDANTPPVERHGILGPKGKLSRRQVHVVVNVGVLTEGFDCPPVSCIIVARPTKSLVLWRQMCGRGARKGGRRKQRYIVLDHAGNVWRHGFPDSPVEWSLEGREKPSSGDSPVRRCEECGAINPLGATECSECGAVFPARDLDLKERQGELEKVRRARSEREAREKVLRKLAASRGLGEEWVENALQGVA